MAERRMQNLRISWLPDYRAVFGNNPSLSDIQAWLARYPVSQWLGMLGRIQTAIAGTRSDSKKWVQALFHGILPLEVQRRVLELAEGPNSEGLRGLFHERQVATLQQLAILQSPSNGDAEFGSEEDFKVLIRALLAVFTLMDSPKPAQFSTDDWVLQRTVQDYYRTRHLPVELYALRALDLWQLAEPSRNPSISTLLDLFRPAYGHDPVDFMVGGIGYFINEFVKDSHQLAEGTHLYPLPEHYRNEREINCRKAYVSIRSQTQNELIQRIGGLGESPEQLADWSLIAMHETPILLVEGKGHMLLNLASVGASIADGVRHALWRAALDDRLPDGWRGPQRQKRIEGEYGKIFEEYILRTLRATCGDRLFRIPVDPSKTREKRADVIVLGENAVAVVEIKGGLFRAVEHYRSMPIGERREELRNRLKKGLEQLHCTIDALRNEKLKIPGFQRNDWTMIPIVPVLITEERIPTLPLVWEKLIHPILPTGLTGNTPLPTAPARLLNLGELEWSMDVIASEDFAGELYKWGMSPSHVSQPWTSWLDVNGKALTREHLIARFNRLKDFVASHLGLADV